MEHGLRPLFSGSPHACRDRLGEADQELPIFDAHMHYSHDA